MYSKRPNRLDLFTIDGQNSEHILAKNAEKNGDKINWLKPSPQYIPTLSDTTGANYHERDAQKIHMIFTGGVIYELRTKETLILELGVITELTEDEFYDNGNLAKNLAALLGIKEDQIRMMNVIRETGDNRRKRRAALGYKMHHSGRHRRDTTGQTLQFEIEPATNTVAAREALDTVGQTIVAQSASIVQTAAAEVKKVDPNAEVETEVAVAAPPVQPPTPPKAVTIAEKLQMAEIQPGESVESFLKKVEEKLDVPLASLKTAEQVAAEQQQVADKQMEPVVREEPAVMEIIEQPTTKQILNAKYSEVTLLNFLSIINCQPEG